MSFISIVQEPLVVQDSLYLTVAGHDLAELCGLPVLQDQESSIDLANSEPAFADFYEVKNKDQDEAAQHRGGVGASHPAVPGSILCIPEINSLDLFSQLPRFIYGTAQNRGQWLNNVDQAHLLLLDIITRKDKDQVSSGQAVWLRGRLNDDSGFEFRWDSKTFHIKSQTYFKFLKKHNDYIFKTKLPTIQAVTRAQFPKDKDKAIKDISTLIVCIASNLHCI